MSSLTGPDLILAPLREADADLLFEWINDRDLVLLSSPFRPIGRPDHDEWFRRIRERSDTVIFGIRLSDGDRLIGSCQLNTIDERHRTCELQIRIGDAGARGMGYGSQAVSLLVKYAFQDLGLERVQVHVFETNQRAIRVYERVGFKREGVLRQAALIDSERVDVVVMGILSEDCEKSDGA